MEAGGLGRPEGSAGCEHARVPYQQQILENLRDGVWAFDRDGRTLYANRRTCEILGRTPAEMMDLGIADVLDDTGRLQFAAHLDQLHSTGVNEAEVTCVFVHRDGTPVHAIVSESELADDEGFVVRITLDDERQALVHDLTRSRERLDEAQAIARLGSWERDLVTEEVTWSNGMYRLLGVDPVGPVPNVRQFLDLLVEEDRAPVEQAIVDGTRAGVLDFEGRFVRPGGGIGWVRGLGRVVSRAPDGTPTRISGTLQDVTELKEAELALRDSVVITSLMQVIAAAANEAATLEQALVVTGNLLLAHEDWQRALVFSVPDDPDALPEATLVLTDGPADGPTEAERRVARRTLTEGEVTFGGGSDPNAPSLGFLVAGSGGPDAVAVVTARSPFERHEMLRQLAAQIGEQLGRVGDRERAARALADARDEAEEASRLKSQFLATMSHEIRTPMNGVIGLNELLLRSDLDPAQRRLAEGVQTAGRSLLAILSDILDLSKIEAGQLELEVVDFEVDPVFQQACTLSSAAARERDLDLSLEIDPDVPSRLRGDPGRLAQVIANLVSNAVKFTPSGSVRVRVATDASSEVEVVLRVAVTDTGIGISPEQQRRIFDPFQQADASTTRTFGGTGLGLAISQELVRTFGGELGVSSVAGQGSTFWFTARLARASAAREARTSAVPTDGPPGRAGRVLVVEDNDVNQLVARGLLEALGFEVHLAGDGEAGATLALAGDYVAVLMDLRMPRVDGYESTRRIRAAEPEGRRVPIIAMTASALEGERERCLAAGMDDFLTKPVDHRRLGAVLQAQLTGQPAPPPVPPEPVPTADGAAVLDTDRLDELLEMGEGAELLVARTLDNFVAGAADTLDGLRSAAGAGDAGTVSALAHRLKGSALNLGVNRVAAAARALDEAGRAGTLDGVDVLLADLDHEIDRGVAALQDFRAR